MLVVVVVMGVKKGLATEHSWFLEERTHFEHPGGSMKLLNARQHGRPAGF